MTTRAHIGFWTNTIRRWSLSVVTLSPKRPAGGRARLLALVVTTLLAGCRSATYSSGPASGSTPRSTPAGKSLTAPSLAAPRPRSYAALGASETYGVGASPVTKSYAYLTAAGLHARHFADVGIPAVTLAAAYDTELTNALAVRPALCTVFFGVNDLRAHVARAAFLQDMHDLVLTLRRAGAQVLIIGIPDLSVVPAVAAAHLPRLHATLSAWNTGMRHIAKQTGAYFLDLTPYSLELARHRGYIAADGLHPSNAGHARLAQIVIATARQDGIWRQS